MAARSVRVRPLPDRLEALDDVISISSDCDSDDSLPSISAIVASMSIPRPVRTESISEHSQVMRSGMVKASSRQESSKNEVFTCDNQEVSDPSSLNSPIEAAVPSSNHFGHPAKTSKIIEFVDDSNELTPSTRDQHTSGMSFSSCSPTQETPVELISGRSLFVHQANSLHQTAPASTTCHPRSHIPSMMSSNQSIPVHGGDTNFREMIRSTHTKASQAEHTTRALAQGNPAGGDEQESAHKTSPSSTYPGLSSGQRRWESRQTTINLDKTTSQLEATGDNLQNQLHSHRTRGSGYNLRPSPVERQYGGERLSAMLPGKRRKPEGCASPGQRNVRQKTGLKQHAETEASVCRVDCLLARWRKHIFLVKWYEDDSNAIITTWEPRTNILDKTMLADFEAKWRGFNAGVDVLRTRRRGGKWQYLLHWHGRSSKEDTWLNEDLLSSQLMGRIKETGLDVYHI
ncbi:chromo (CHRromatin organization MOdifier) domain-containing protein [Pochonia chlamydosporia 170]|uniref:Chromo (CHRromatin organization MOdifier) domain-containing protein n=1 Tax=Pochonia chlamydosporia 170 TaxID=1380566 RepID=A0A179EYJ2_METCM|nr:chromo (CHRromatin organization MOdifier) domain-containing protein [Pochonia chlamydosporia 170]OAQ58267.1 chromo (CHRromatin organization MOdifier) domain-containing protein [Pochonia chlamydosporia 170]